MTEETTNRVPDVTLKIRPEDKKWVKNQVNRLANEPEAQSLTHAQFFKLLRGCYEESIGRITDNKGTVSTLESADSKAIESKGSPEIRRALGTLRSILESGHKKAIAAIRQNLDAFEELVRRASGEAFESVVTEFDAKGKAIAENERKPPPHATTPRNLKADSRKRRKAP